MNRREFLKLMPVIGSALAALNLFRPKKTARDTNSALGCNPNDSLNEFPGWMPAVITAKTDEDLVYGDPIDVDLETGKMVYAYSSYPLGRVLESPDQDGKVRVMVANVNVLAMEES